MHAVDLVADVGGTNTRVALAHDGVVDAASSRRYRNVDHDGLGAILSHYARAADRLIEGACVAVAGPVRDGAAHLTNLDWSIDRNGVADATGAHRVAVINDLQAQGHALGHLPEGVMTALLPRRDGLAPRSGATRLVVGVGTGFNAAPVYATGAGRHVPPAEVGHTGLPLTCGGSDLVRDVAGAQDFPAVEEVLSGRGLEALHARTGGRRQSAEAIMSACGADAEADRTVEAFVLTLGTVVGDLALTFLPFGGIYLVGGVSRAVAPHIDRFGFAGAFRGKGRFAGLMDSFSVELLADDDAALTGAARHLRDATPELV